MLVSNVAAQEVVPRIGMTIAKTNASAVGPVEQKFKIGFTFGAGVEFKINSFFAFQPELNFVQKGFRVKYSETDQGSTLKVDNRTAINYLEIPALMRIYFGNSSTKYFVMAGPALGVGIGGKAKTKVEADLFGTDFSVTVKSKVKFGDPPDNYNPEEDREFYIDNRIDVGLYIGFGVFIKDKIFIEARYNHGLSPLMDEDEDSKNRVIQISAGVPWTIIRGALTKK